MWLEEAKKQGDLKGRSWHLATSLEEGSGAFKVDSAVERQEVNSPSVFCGFVSNVAIVM